MNSEQIIASLKELVATGDAPGKVLTDPADLDTYGKDWTKIHPPKPLAIVLPKTTEQVQAVVKFANEHKVALVPSGGRTGLSAGAVAANGEVVVAFDNMNQILEFNASDRTVRCQSGVVTEQLQNFAEENGLYYPVDFASAGSSQLGGNLSTNAGGIKVIRYGMSRDWVAGLKVVTGKGDILDLNKDLEKNNTGYDLRHLFIGAEGTLGFITEATMKLTRQPDNLTVLVLGLGDLTNTMDVLQKFQSKLDLTAYEFFSHQAMNHVLAHGQVQAPFETEAPYYALLEFEAVSDQVMDDAMSLFEHCVEEGWVLDGVISQSETQAQNLWQLRDFRVHSPADSLQERRFCGGLEGAGLPAGNRRRRHRTLPGLRNHLVRPHRRRQPAPEHPEAGRHGQGRLLREVPAGEQVGVRDCRTLPGQCFR